MIDFMKVADQADMIINGYAFTKENELIRVLNLNNTDKSVVVDKDGKVLETSMDDIEIQIVKNYLNNNLFVKENGDTMIQNRGVLNDREILKIQ